MTTPEFVLDVVLAHLWTYVLTFLGCALFLYRLVRPRLTGLLDPMLFVIFTAACDCAAVLSLWAADALTASTVAAIWSATLAFFLLFSVASSRFDTVRLAIPAEAVFPTKLIVIGAGLLIAIKYLVWGVPLLSEGSRLSGFFGSSQAIYAAIVMATDAMLMAVLFSELVARQRIARGWLWISATLALLLIDGFLTGSKSGPILGIAAVWQLSRQFSEAHREGARAVSPLGYVAIGAALIGFFVLAAVARYGVDGYSAALVLFGVRIAQTSDIYYYSIHSGGLYSSGSGLIGFLQVAFPMIASAFGGHATDLNYGQDIFLLANGFENTEAPNARLIALAVSTTGYGGILLAGATGFLVGLLRRFAIATSSAYWMPVFLIAPTFFIDFPYAVGRLKWGILTIIAMYACAHILGTFRGQRERLREKPVTMS